jgi:hypothetical protein
MLTSAAGPVPSMHLICIYPSQGHSLQDATNIPRFDTRVEGIFPGQGCRLEPIGWLHNTDRVC